MSNLIKIVVLVPEEYSNKVRMAMGDAGAGKIGNYSHCSFTTKGIGNFLPGEGANPFIGEVGKMEEVKEDKIEVICEKEQAKEVIEAMKKVHPYEEIAFDIYTLLDEEEL